MFFPCKEFRFSNPDLTEFKPFKLDKAKGKASKDMGLSNTLICHNEEETSLIEGSLVSSSEEVTSSIEGSPAASASTRVRRGHPINAVAKRMIKSAAYLLEKQFTKDCLSFITITLPGLEEEDLQRCNRNFPELTRKFCQGLKRLLEKKGLCSEYVCVTEVQEKRWANRGEVALHLHILCQGRQGKSSGWSMTPAEIRTIWERVLSKYLGYELTCSAATRIERVKKSACNYLGKYMSKGGKVIKEVNLENRGSELPPSWYRMANSLRCRIKAAIIHPNADVKRYIIDYAEELKNQGVLAWYFPIYFDCSVFGYYDKNGNPVQKLVSFCGAFTTEEWMHSFSSLVS